MRLPGRGVVGGRARLGRFTPRPPAGPPPAAARATPNICSALGLNSTITPRSSIAITASKADAIIADFTASLSWTRASELRWARNAAVTASARGRQSSGSRGSPGL